MHFYRILSLSCLFAAPAEADVTTASLAAVPPLAPPCAVNCITSRLLTVPTFQSNPSMICTNISLQAALSTCVQAGCNYTEQAEVAFLNAQICAGYPIESRSTLVAVFGLVCGPLALLAVVLRCYSRLSISERLGSDDWLIVAAAAFLGTVTAIDIYNSWGNGFGRHYWNVDPLRVTQLLKILYSGEVMYLVIMMLVKASILVFYLRVFSAAWFKAVDIVVLFFTISSGLGTIFAVIAQCTPISGAWDKVIHSRCVNVNALAFASGGISIGLDVIILLLPVPELLGIRMSFRKKMNLLVMFSLGSFACITSIVRLNYLVDFAKSTDLTYDNSLAVIWTILEVSVAVICSCLPAIRVLFSRWLPALFDLNNPHEPASASSGTLSHPMQKIGPSYNKHYPILSNSPVFSPLTSAFNLSPAPSHENETETKIWINPKFDDAGQLVDFHSSELSPHYSQTPSHAQWDRRSSVPTESTSTSLWVLDGLRYSGEYGPNLDIAEPGMSMGNFLSAPGKARFTQVQQKRPQLQSLMAPLQAGQNANENGCERGRSVNSEVMSYDETK